MKTSAVLFDEPDGPPKSKWWRQTVKPYRSEEQSVKPWINVEERYNRLWADLKDIKGESLSEYWTRMGTPMPEPVVVMPEPVVVPVLEELIWPVSSAGPVLQLSAYINELHEMILDLREEVRELQGEL